jgi:hypothetical protein
MAGDLVDETGPITLGATGRGGSGGGGKGRVTGRSRGSVTQGQAEAGAEAV